MGTDQFIITISNVCSYLLPVAGLVLLVFLIVFFKNLITALKTLNQTLAQTNKMVEECDKQIQKLDGPLNTINELSETVDNVHEASKKALTSTIAIILNNLSVIKEKFADKKNSDQNFDAYEKTDESEAQ